MDKSLGTLLRFWGVFQFTQVQPLPLEFFCEFQLCIGWGEGERQENFEKDALFLEGTKRKYRQWKVKSVVRALLKSIISLYFTIYFVQ